MDIRKFSLIMKGLSRHKSSKQRLMQITVIALVCIAFGMVVPRLISLVAVASMAPIHGVNTWLEESTSLVPSFIRSRLALQAEIESLKNQIIVSERSNLTQQRLVEENNRLRQLLGADENSRIAAAVIARPGELPYDVLQIDRGSRQGVQVGAPVFVGKDIVIGLVVHTAPDYAFVELITTPSFEATAFIAGPDVVVTMEGVGGGVARVRVPQGIPLATGNLVYLPSVEPGLFGRISHIENQPTQPEQYGYISPDVPLSSLYQVTVGKVSQVSQSAEEINQRISEEMRRKLSVEGVVVTEAGTTSDSLSTSSEDLP